MISQFIQVLSTTKGKADTHLPLTHRFLRNQNGVTQGCQQLF